MARTVHLRLLMLLAHALACGAAVGQPFNDSAQPSTRSSALPDGYVPMTARRATVRITGVTEVLLETGPADQQATGSPHQLRDIPNDLPAAGLNSGKEPVYASRLPEPSIVQPLEPLSQHSTVNAPFMAPPLSLRVDAPGWSSAQPPSATTTPPGIGVPTIKVPRLIVPAEQTTNAYSGSSQPAQTPETTSTLVDVPLIPPPPIDVPRVASNELLPSAPAATQNIHGPAAGPATWPDGEPGIACDYSPFSPDPNYANVPYSAEAEIDVYAGKWCIPTQRPWVELWRPLYAAGELPPGLPFLGERNLVLPHFLLFGDFRTAVAYNDNGNSDKEKFVWANRLNLDFDFKITATERIHAFWGPIDEDGRFTRVEENDGQIELFEEFDDDFDTLFFEGDAGYIWGGMTDQYAPFDLPFVAGKYPLLFQNGVWLVDALEGFALTIPAKNSPVFDWSNYDLTFFFAYDDVDSPAFGKDDNLANVYGFNWFLEAYEGYWEIGYAFLEDTTAQGLSYNNIGLAYTRRYLQRLSNSVRVIVNTGQAPVDGVDTADGTLLLIENALVSHNPTNFVPYLNLFAGFGRPQSVARAGGAGGILLNTGINFETDGLTGFPTLDATANDTYGGAIGFNWLGPDFSWQLINEFAMVQTHGNDPNRNAQNDQYAFGMRFQLPLTNAWLVRFDSMYGIIENEPDVRGARMELRWKF